jgi:hypothetical protein
MSDFTAAAAAPTGTLDPLKRVRYSFGLVLGVDEFQQEQHYLMERNRLHNRLLHGYGTVSGLAIELPAADDPDAVLRVRPGVAVDQHGREIVVPRTMCVKLARWLERYGDFLDAQGLIDDDPTASPPLPPAARLAVILCYRECETDAVPVPGEPCRAQEDAMEASRIADSFELRLAVRGEAPVLSPPDRLPDGLAFWHPSDDEEAAVRAFGALLDRLGVAAAPGDETDVETLRDAVRALAPDADAAPDLTSPPGGPLLLPADPGEAAEALRDMFRVWVTEVRPRLETRALGTDASRCAPAECCVLLAELTMEVTAAGAVGAVAADESARPYLLHTRLLQECVLHRTLGGGSGGGGPVVIPPAGGDASGPLGALQVVGLRTRPVAGAAPGEGDVLTFAAGTWTPRALPASPPPPPVTLAGDVTGAAGANTVARIRGTPVAPASPNAGQVLTFDGSQWAPAAIPPAPGVPNPGGDVTGTIPAMTVARIRGQPVAAATPTNGQVLTFTGGAWTPQSLPSSGGPFVPMPGPGTPIAIVAAGVVDIGKIDTVGPTYGALKVRRSSLPTNTFFFVLTFAGYEFPPKTEGKLTYVLKGVGNLGWIRFESFVDADAGGPGGIQIEVIGPNGPVREGLVMVEITRIA